MATKTTKSQLVNEQIRSPQVRVISSAGDQLGVMPTKEAQKLAYDEGLDLVMISENAEPPVVKIIDYNRYLYDLAKKQKEIKKNQKVVEVKELRFTVNIDINDMNTKAKHGVRFLKEGNKVKVQIRLRGREMGRPELAIKVLNDFFELLKEVGTMEREPKQEGRNVIMVVTPNITTK